MEASASACVWCGAGGDEGSASTFVVPAPAEISPVTAQTAQAVGVPEVFSPAIPADPYSPVHKNLNGIGGWLILVGIDLALTPLGILFALSTDLMLILSGQSPAPLSTRQSMAGLLAFDAFANIMFLAGLVALNLMFYGKKKDFPRWIIRFLVVRFIVAAGIHQMVMNDVPTYPVTAAFGSFVSAAVWIPYFLISQRVKQTFVN